MKQPQVKYWKYIGDGASLDDIPARDLTIGEWSEISARLKPEDFNFSALYMPIYEEPTALKTEEAT